MNGPSKSDIFRQLYDEGYSVAEITKITGDYYSFVYRVIKRYKFQKDHTEPSENSCFSFGTNGLKSTVAELCNDNDVDAIMNQLNLPEEKRSYVYKVWLQTNGH